MPAVGRGTISRMPKRRASESFADVVAHVKASPVRPALVRPGRHGDTWGDRSQRRAYELVTDELSPADARALVAQGAALVYDECGCGGVECRLDWVSSADAQRLAVAGPPVLHPPKNGRADLEHWRSADGRNLVVAAVAVTWGSRIIG